MAAWRLDRAFSYAVPEHLNVEVGSLVRVPLGARRVRGIVVAEGGGDGAAGPLLEIAASPLEWPLCPPPLDELFDWLARRYAAPRGSAYARAVPPRVRVRVEAPAHLEPRAPGSLGDYERGDALLEAIRSRQPGVWCVQSIPGDDHGRVIAELVGATAPGGGATLVAVPEVRYGSAVLDDLQAAWPELARVDSARGDAARARGWLRLAAGHPLGAGGRAVVLAPSPKVGLVVVDDEHNPAYKEDRAPRFDARRVAVERARLQGAVCVFVSVAPSVELGAAARAGEARFVEPTRAAARAARPTVEIVARPDDRTLSHELHKRMQSELRRGGSVALLTPSRGYARALWCAGCRRSVRCPRCEAGLFLDGPAAMRPARVRCGRCRWVGAVPQACPACGARDFRRVGAGVERVAEQVAKAFPRARVRRMDPDVVQGAPAAPPPADIYVTTWIGTKASLRPPASLVGVLEADGLIRRPDFRAAESAYQALAEMAEWAGPAGGGGRLVVQTSEPNHHAIQAIVRADYRFFLERELEHRRDLVYPPFSELIKLSASGPEAEALVAAAGRACRAHAARVLGPITVADPGGGEPRLEVLVKCDEAERVAGDLRGILASAPAKSRLRVDVDPR